MRVGFLVAVTFLVATPLSAQTDARLLGPRTLTPSHVLCADLPAAARPVPTLHVAGGHGPDGRQSLVKGDTVVINAGTAQGLSTGQRFVARRVQGAPEEFPKPGQGFGAVRTAGILTVTALGDTTSLALIDFACDPIEPGDYLEVYQEPALPSTARPMAAPQFDDRATVLFGADRRESFGDGDVLSIDRGTAQGVAVGDRYAIYRDHRDGLPLFHLGDAVVVDLAELTSKVVLVTVNDAIQTGDVVVARRLP